MGDRLRLKRLRISSVLPLNDGALGAASPAQRPLFAVGDKKKRKKLRQLMLVAPVFVWCAGVRILQDFAGFFRGKSLISFSISLLLATHNP